MYSFASRLLLIALVAAPVRAEPPRYFGLDPPDSPEMFEPPLLAGSRRVLTNLALAPGRRHAAFSVIEVSDSGKVSGSIHESWERRGKWSALARVDIFGAEPGAGEGSFSPDGRWFYFSSDRPPGGPMRPRVFRAPVRGGAFGAPQLVPLEIPEAAGAYYPRQRANGDLFFTSRGPMGGDDLFVARATASGFDPPQPLAGDFNSPKDDWDLVESRDGKLRLWASARDGGLGKTDIFYSRFEKETWSPAQRVQGVSTPALETAPVLSPDDEVLFFLRRAEGRERMFWVRLESVLE